MLYDSSIAVKSWSLSLKAEAVCLVKVDRQVAVCSREVSEMCGVTRLGLELKHTIANFLHTYLVSPALGRALGIPQCLEVFLVKQIMSLE